MKKTVTLREYVGDGLNPFTNEIVEEFNLIDREIDVPPPLHVKEKFLSDKKAIISGNVIEIIEYSEPVLYGVENVAKTGKVNTDNKKTIDNINKSKMSLRRLINANYCDGGKFVTLTFRENLQDIGIAKKHFKNFVKKLNYLRKKDGLENLKYVYVVEFQKRGAIHFHSIFFNMGYISNDYLTDLWGHGFSRINLIKNCDNVGAYVVKYMGKALGDDRLSNRDLYGRSKGNLVEPKVLKKACEVSQLLQAYKDNVVYYQSYYTHYRGNVTYSQINLNRSREDACMYLLKSQLKNRR